MECRNCREKKREWQENTGLCNKCAAEEGSRLYNEQGGKCAICGDPLGQRVLAGSVPPDAQLDHDHHSGQIRGVLCKKCNLGLGNFNDNTSRLRAAADYLDKWKQMTRK